jgi:DNA-nicking Smr family endonuclease
MVPEDSENFEKLLQESLESPEFERFLKEKKADRPARKSVGEIIKDYPDVQGTLDLHERTRAEANIAIKRFIRLSKESRLRTVRVISGKGTGVIKNFTDELLTELRQQKFLLHFRAEKRTASFIVYL